VATTGSRAGCSPACAERLLLEYYDERSGSFDALEGMPEDKTVVLGLVTTKTGRIETEDQLSARIGEASRFVPLERLALSPRCGFATSVGGNAITVEQERAKLRAIVDTGAAIWGAG
jgi:5-methyltetrahydropteroyltriglutamate--homocysteine methyltransferase